MILKKPIKSILSFFYLTIVITAFLSCGCNAKGSKAFELFCFDTTARFESYSKKISSQAQSKIKDLLIDMENNISVSKESSSIYKFNHGKANDSFILDEFSKDIIELSILNDSGLYSMTDGRFNVAVYPLKTLWEGKQDDAIILDFPSEKQIETAKNACVLENALEYDKDSKTLVKKLDTAMLDLGGVAKGYALDKIKDILKDDGVTDGYVSLGSSSVYLFDVKALSIRHPRASENIPTIATINKNFHDLSLSTSGDYERILRTKDGKNYSHIIDPFTGYPVDTGISSATVIGKNGAFIDGFSTAITLCNYDENNPNNELALFIKKLLQIDSDIKYFICYNKNNDKFIFTNFTENEFIVNDDSYLLKSL